MATRHLGETYTFYVNTHDITTGAETDADSAPTWRLYEEETATPILTGTMSLLDGTNTVGFYSDQVLLTAANGCERGKSYLLRIRAVVSGVAGSLCQEVDIDAFDYPQGAVVTDGANTASTFKTDLTESTNDYWKSVLLQITSGVLSRQVQKISAYNGTSKFVTLAAPLTAAPAAGSTFILVNR